MERSRRELSIDMVIDTDVVKKTMLISCFTLLFSYRIQILDHLKHGLVFPGISRGRLLFYRIKINIGCRELFVGKYFSRETRYIKSKSSLTS